jgi:peptidoglycan/LPS O-acetylase OafA/YrhL
MEKLDRPIQDMPQLDGLRTFAVFAAIFSHYIPDTCHYFNYGHSGVQLFFTISGFLITGILLNCRSSIDDNNCGVGFYLKQFYIRRFIRIFPLYYGVLAIVALQHQLGDTLPFHLTYTSNIHMAMIGKIIPACHFWSLCVEEQFYLFWPLLLFYAPKANFQRWIFALIPFSFLFRVYCLLKGYPEQTGYLLTTNFDCLATGALLAVAFRNGTEVGTVRRYVRWAGIAGLILLAVVVTLSILYPAPHKAGSVARSLFQNTVIALISASVVWNASFGYSGIVGRVLSLAPLRYLGRISYGLYVIHLFVPKLTHDALANAGYALPRNAAVSLNLAVTIVLASLSWHFFEAPINRLKKFFPYKRVPSNKTSMESEPVLIA